ncbi:hypothetical protein [Arthrobacter globiformis]|uniref:hypothetical protein n=1 Tax=Arthrobacter globiformis TaxID=1665 RepID=UPI00278D707D|nr:hypothetical protein [Arthrobacter globiformis]MDQ0617383.1 hypothetical protein [Arthrobacter globiformis]
MEISIEELGRQEQKLSSYPKNDGSLSAARYFRASALVRAAGKVAPPSSVFHARRRRSTGPTPEFLYR